MTAARLHLEAPPHRAPSAPARTRSRHPLVGRILRGIAWALLVCLSLFGAALLHLSMRVGRAAASDLVTGLANGRTRGTWHVGSMTRLDFDGVEMHDLVVTSPEGERVLSADRLTGEFAFFESLHRGALVLTPCAIEGGEMRITRGPGDQIALVHTLEVPSDRSTIPAELRDVRLSHHTISLQLPGIPGELRMHDVSGLLDVTIDHEFLARLDQLRGTMSSSIVSVRFDRLSGRLRSDDAQPLVVRLVLELDVADPGMELRYSAPRAVGGEGGAHAGIELGVDVPDPTGVATHRRAPP